MLGQGKGSRLDPKRFYQRRSWQLEKAEKSLTRIDRLLVTAKMMTVLSLPFVFLNHALRSPSAMGLSLGLLVILFLLHDPFLRRLREIEATRRWLERELGRLRNGPSPAPPDWMRFQGDHPYDFDLNISGDNGLFVFLSRCRTRIGEITLHRWLLQPVPVSERIRRQEAILELSRQLRFRERFLCDPRESKAAASICSCPAMERVPKKAILPGWLLFLPLLNLPALVLGITGLWWPMMALFFVQFNDKMLIIRNSEFRQSEHYPFCFLTSYQCQVVMRPQWHDYLFLNSGTFGYFFINYFESDIIHVKRFIG